MVRSDLAGLPGVRSVRGHGRPLAPASGAQSFGPCRRKPDRRRAVGKILLTLIVDGGSGLPGGRAEVGTAIGVGIDVAIDSAGITLLNGDLTGMSRPKLFQATRSNIRQNTVRVHLQRRGNSRRGRRVLSCVQVAAVPLTAAAMALSPVKPAHQSDSASGSFQQSVPAHTGRRVLRRPTGAPGRFDHLE